MLVANGFKISFWLQLNDGGWEREAVIDAEEKLRSLHHYIPPGPVQIEFEGSREMSTAVLLRIWFNELCPGPFIVLDVETKEMHKKSSHPSLLFEVDLSPRLLATKTFS